MKVIEKIKQSRKDKKGDIEESLRRIEEASMYAEPGTPEWDALRKAYEQELRNKELRNQLKFFGIPADKLIMPGLILVLGVFAFALDQESPAALKIAKTVIDVARVSKG